MLLFIFCISHTYFSGGGVCSSFVVIETPLSARKMTTTMSSSATQRPKTAPPKSSAHVADRKCNSATVSSGRKVDDMNDIETSCYMYEPHVVVQRRDENNRIYSVLVPVGKAVPIVETAPSRQSSDIAAAASTPDAKQMNSHERRRKTAAIDPPSLLDVTGHHGQTSLSTIDRLHHLPATSPRPHTDSRLSNSATIISSEGQHIQSPKRSSSVYRPVSVEKRTVQSAVVTAMVPEGGGVGLDIEVMRLIASVDSLHVPSSRRSNSAPTTRLKSKRTIQTIMADLERIF